MEYKTILVTFGINKNRFRDNFVLESELQKYFRVFSMQIMSIKDYLYEFVNTYRFFEVGTVYKGITKNFPDYSKIEDAGEEQSLRRLALSFNIADSSNQNSASLNRLDMNEILFEWESRLTEKITKKGINDYVKLYFKYFILSKVSGMSEAESIASLVNVKTYEWHNYEISEVSSNVYTPEDNEVLHIFLEIYLPKKYFYLLSNAVSKIKEIFSNFSKLLAIGIKIKFIEFVWR